MSEQANKRRVLVVTAGVGAGHNQAARALMEALQNLADIELARIDAMELAPTFFRMYYSGGFGVLMSRLGWLYGLGFRLFDRPQRPGRALGERIRLAWERLCLGGLRRAILDFAPDLVVHTHFLAGPIVAWLIERCGLRCRQSVVLTDICPHRWWYSQRVDRYFVPVPEAAQVLARWGIDRRDITVSGIPIMAKWSQPVDRAKALADWKLPADRKVVVLSAGAEFTAGPVVKIAQGLLRSADCIVLVLAGRNKKLLARLATLPEAAKGLLVPVGFTDRNNELVNACSLMVAKPGGITTAECLAAGAPMLLLRPVPGQEAGNARYLSKHGVAVVTRNARDAVAKAAGLLSDETALAELAAGARRLARPDATRTICKELLELLERPV